jgi:hypothetical protein
MSDLISAAKQALEALDAGPNAYLLMNTGGIANKLHQAIAEAEKQEPVAYWNGASKFALPKAKEWDKRTGGTTAFGIDIPLYTHPQPKREWVGLTNDEVNNFAAGCHLGKSVQCAVYEAETKLKEKNT